MFLFLISEKTKMKFSDFVSNPYALNLAISNSCEIQSKAFDRSLNTAAKTPILSQISSGFSIITKAVLCPKSFSKTAHIFREFVYKEIFI